MTKSIQTMACLLFLAISMNLFAGAPQIYRCEIDDVVIFADAPCNDEAAVHVPRMGISVVEPAADLDQIAERNREFIRQREERQAAIRAAQHARAERERYVAPTVIAPQTVYLPYWVGPTQTRNDTDRDRNFNRRTPPALDRDDDRFSALRGPFPGTRRPDRQP